MIYSQIWFSSQVQFTDWLTEWFSWKIQFIFEYFHNKLIEHASRTNLWYCMMYFWYFCVVFFKSWNIILLFIVIELKWVTSPILYFIRIFSFCVPRRKVMTGWNNIRVNKWWQDFHSCVKFSFKPKSMAERKKKRSSKCHCQYFDGEVVFSIDMRTLFLRMEIFQTVDYCTLGTQPSCW